MSEAGAATAVRAHRHRTAAGIGVMMPRVFASAAQKRSTSEASRSAAALALAEIGRPDTVAEVARLLDDDEKSIAITAPVNTFAVKALEKFGTPEALQALAEWKAREERRA